MSRLVARVVARLVHRPRLCPGRTARAPISSHAKINMGLYENRQLEQGTSCASELTCEPMEGLVIRLVAQLTGGGRVSDSSAKPRRTQPAKVRLGQGMCAASESVWECRRRLADPFSCGTVVVAPVC